MQQMTHKIDDMDRRFNMLDNAQKTSEELHNLKQQDISAIVSAVDDMRYADIKASAQNDKSKVDQVTADYKALVKELVCAHYFVG